MALGAVAVEDKDWVGALHELASREKAKAIFGDFSTLILDAILAYRYPVTGSKEAIAILREFQERVKQGIYADWVTASLYAVRSFPRTYPECLWPTHKAWTYVGDL